MLSFQARDRSLEAAACGALGLARRLQRRLDAALGHHTQVSCDNHAINRIVMVVRLFSKTYILSRN